MFGSKYINLYSILTLLFILYIFYIFCKKKIKQFKQQKDTIFNLDLTEYESFVNSNMLNPEHYTYLFWNGGFSSTFRLCQILLIEEKPVQTIYINCCNLGENTIKNEMEIRAMKAIRNILIKKYPAIKHNFPPTKYISKIKKDTSLTNKYDILHTEYELFEFNSKKDKYENLARFSYNNEYPIELPIDNDETHLNSAISNYLESFNLVNHKRLIKDLQENSNKYINKYINKDINKDINTKIYHHLDIFKKCIFPIIHLSKNQLLNIAMRDNFNYILNLTWSCNSPTENKMPCNNCSGCMKRIL
jgi:hypothetical protein